MRYFLLLLILGFVSIVSADCHDINSASAGELEELDGIGPVYAGRIIENRPFESVDDLTRVRGIGEKTLEKIKLQGLACMKDEPSEEKKETPKESEFVEGKIVIPISHKKEIVLNEAVGNPEEVVYESKNSKILKYTPYAFSVFLIFVIVILIFDK